MKTFLLSLLMCCLAYADYQKNFQPMRSMDGSEYLDLFENYQVNTRKGATYLFTAQLIPGMRKEGANPFGTFFYKDGEFIFGIRHRCLYFYVSSAGNGSWNYNILQGGVIGDNSTALPENDTSLHQFVLTLSQYVEPDQGIDYTDVKLYLDGSQVSGHRFDHFTWKDAGRKLVAGGIYPENATFKGKDWNFPGKIDSIEVLDRAMTDDEIQNRVKADKRLKPNFLQPKELTEEEQKRLTPKPGATPADLALLSGIRNAAYLGRINLKKINYEAIENSAYLLHNSQSYLTILNDGEYASVTSFYDLQAGRELFAWHSPFFDVTYWDAKRKDYRINGISKEITRRLTMAPRLIGKESWKFAFAGEHKPTQEFPFEFTYTMDCTFSDNRFGYTVKIENLSANGLLRTVNFPSLKFNSFREGNDTLLVPIMSGVEYKNAAMVGATYTESYPRGRCSLQMGAYYDPKGGILFATEDARGQAKNPSFSVGRETSNVLFTWTVPFDKPVGPNRFLPQCAASVTLFRGDWYDAAMTYRQMMERVKPVWWDEKLPNTECPQWFRDNTIWIGRWLNYQDYGRWLQDLENLKKWKAYVGEPGQAVHFYEWCLHFTRDWPHNPASPDFVDRTKAMKAAGYRVVPYINARIWETKDKRNEDYRFTKVGLPATVMMSNGKPSPEPYGDYMFYVICPFTKTYENEMFRECDNCVIYGADGAYLDQIGAGNHYPCYDVRHGHKAADPDTWFMGGHYKVYRKLRDHWKTFAPEAITFGEDIAETTVKTLDGGLTWRWMYDGHVDLFPAVYSGRTQMVGQSWGEERRQSNGSDISAVPAKLTYQLFSGSQLGWFSIDYIVHERMRPYHPLIKQYAHLRMAMLDFFNEGMMSRPPQFEKPQIAVSRVWGRQGTKTVSTMPLQACAWEWKGLKAVLVANTDDKLAGNILKSSFGKGTLHLFTSDGRTETKRLDEGVLALPVSLQPRQFIAALWVPEGKEINRPIQKFTKAFTVIAAANAEADPWK